MSSPNDASLARALAAEAGRELLRVRRDLPAGDQAALKAAGDSASHELLVARLAAERPDDVVLSEEGADPAARAAARRVWIVDPLDGTREFAEGRADWAVHVALWADGELVAGAVALPAEDAVYGTDDPPHPPPAPRSGPVRFAVSRTRPPSFVMDLAATVGGEVVPMGSAGVKCASVWRGEADAYVHAGGQYEWDSAAPVAVARAAGLHTSRVDGAPLVYNSQDPWLPDLLVCRPVHAQRILEAIAAAPTEVTPR